MIVTFRTTAISRHRSGTCTVCGKKGRKRSKTFSQTLNPYNKNEDGSIRTEEDIRHALSVEAHAWQNLPMICATCERA